MVFSQYFWILDYPLEFQETKDMLRDKAEPHFIWLQKYIKTMHRIL